MAFIKKNWFGIFVTFLVLIGMVVSILVFISPKQDAKRRGFIPCTENFVISFNSCDKDSQYTCLLKEILKNSWCDAKVIGEGMSLWVKGEQSAPWSNYIFKPVLTPQPSSEEIDENFYDEPDEDMIFDMQKLKKLNEELEEKLEKDMSNDKNK